MLPVNYTGHFTNQNNPRYTSSIIYYYYSVIQSDGNSFCGNVGPAGFNKTSRDEDNILDQKFKSRYVRIIMMMILFLYKIICKFILTLQYSTNKFDEILVVLCCISLNM